MCTYDYSYSYTGTYYSIIITFTEIYFTLKDIVNIF